MRRRLPTRIFLALWGLWFAVAFVEPAGLMACAMHGVGNAMGVASAVSATPASDRNAAVVAATMDHASMDHMSMAHVSTERGLGAEGNVQANETAPSPSSPPHHCCTCLGACCSALAVAAPMASESLATLVSAADAAPLPPVLTVRAGLRAHSLPFATAPPSTILS